jgi:hypothetical protein
VRAVTYAERSAAVNPLAEELERIAHRLRQGAIAEEVAASKLIVIGEKLILKEWTK